MLSTAQRPITNSYPVEVSGWDNDQSYFVEKSELEWNVKTGKYLTLSRLLCPGSMIFVRLLQPTSPDRALPVAYHAQHLGFTAEGQQQFRLKQIQPNGGLKDTTK